MRVGTGIYSSLNPKKPEFEIPNVDRYIVESAYNTRAIAFFYDKDEYKDEISDWEKTSRHLGQRQNLRLAQVTDTHLIKKLKKTHPEWFQSVGMSSIIVKRYDGDVAKLDITSAE